jgi:hypothetical protein
MLWWEDQSTGTCAGVTIPRKGSWCEMKSAGRVNNDSLGYLESCGLWEPDNRQEVAIYSGGGGGEALNDIFR